ncbi:mechanosensitive ion channel family protein [Alteromonas oceanisediminis]|uniref:mechanosensitive ion channel family protein n=1 Tax=Alteromonas oceanisediminis TaxID=2836180 RepID=UPI001BDB3F84|nr:mechanosensitive ion channel family protein [Alteromonas oceanisediminis]MBT0586671.1 mechanosensitive ion channel family protein [Alteromonas oceanisediminis]
MQDTNISTSLMNDANEFLALVIAKLPALGMGVLFLVLFIVLSGPLSRVLIRPIGHISQSELIRTVARRVVSFMIILVGVYLFLRLAGLTQFAVAVISGTGLIGLVVGFAFKDIAENFISSLLLSVQKPFKLGDVIEVSGHLGVVNQVTSRATTLVDFDGNHIQIPNATVYKSVMKNFTANPFMRGHFVIGIGYDSGIANAQSIALEVTASHPAVLADPEPQVLVDGLGSSTVNLKVYFWINSEQHSLVKVSSVLMRTVMRALERAGVSMPDDAREVIFPAPLRVELADPSDLVTQSGSSTSAATAIPSPEATEAKPMQQQDTQLNNELDGTGSDTHDIRQQAARARSPEQGGNIL